MEKIYLYILWNTNGHKPNIMTQKYQTGKKWNGKRRGNRKENLINVELKFAACLTCEFVKKAP